MWLYYPFLSLLLDFTEKHAIHFKDIKHWQHFRLGNTNSFNYLLTIRSSSKLMCYYSWQRFTVGHMNRRDLCIYLSFVPPEPALHASDKLLSQQAQWELWAGWNSGQRQQAVGQLVHRVPAQQRLRRDQVLGRRFRTLVLHRNMHGPICLFCVSLFIFDTSTYNLKQFSFTKTLLGLWCTFIFTFLSCMFYSVIFTFLSTT